MRTTGDKIADHHLLNIQFGLPLSSLPPISQLSSMPMQGATINNTLALRYMARELNYLHQYDSSHQTQWLDMIRSTPVSPRK